LLASALKGFSPTPEFPEIAEAQTLLAAPKSCERIERREGTPLNFAHRVLRQP
jgi:hypothetical protein